MLHSLENDTSGRDHFHNNICLESHTTGDRQTKEQGSQPFFTKHYRKHSKQLVNALQQWANHLKFTSCEYTDGCLQSDVPDRIEPEYVAYIEQMKKHLNKAYANLLPNHLEIENNHKEICHKIENVMVSVVSTIPYKPSYQKIVTNKIETLCPTLKSSEDIQLTDNNIYLYNYIFGKIFDTIQRRQSGLTLSIEPTSNTDVKQLQYEHRLTLGQGEDASMKGLKQAIGELVVDKDILARISEYKDLHNRLINDEQINQLNVVIRGFRTRIQGGAPVHLFYLQKGNNRIYFQVKESNSFRVKSSNIGCDVTYKFYDDSDG